MEIIERLAREHFIEKDAPKFIGHLARPHRDDIIAELYLIVCELPAHALTDRYRTGGMDAVRGYVAGIIVKQLISDHSRIFKKFIRHSLREVATDPCTWQRDTSEETS